MARMGATMVTGALRQICAITTEASLGFASATVCRGEFDTTVSKPGFWGERRCRESASSGIRELLLQLLLQPLLQQCDS